MAAPPKPWELSRSQTSLPISSTNNLSPQNLSTVSTAASSNTGTNQNSTLAPTTGVSNLGLGSNYGSGLLGRRSMMSRPGMMGYGMGGMYGGGLGSSMYGGGMGGMYGGMGGMGGMYGMQGYGTPSKGMIAIERFSMLVNSLCFTAETIENSMNSMKVFWETIVRIKSWGAGGLLAIQKMLHDKLSYFIHYFLYLIGKGEKPKSKDGISIKSLVLNISILYILLLGVKFCWSEFTKPNEEIVEDLDMF